MKISSFTFAAVGAIALALPLVGCATYAEADAPLQVAAGLGVNVHSDIGSAVPVKPVGYDRFGRARLEGARRPITSGHKEAGAGRTMLVKRSAWSSA